MPNANDVLVWVQVGNTILQVAVMSISKLHDLLDGQDGTDEAILGRLDGEYAARIKRAEAAAGK